MCVFYIENPNDTLYYTIDVQLKISGISVLTWAYFNWKLLSEIGDAHETLLGGVIKVPCSIRAAQIGATGLALHCACLDGTIWPPLFYNSDGRFPPVPPTVTL